jgi:hypothetical protein
MGKRYLAGLLFFLVLGAQPGFGQGTTRFKGRLVAMNGSDSLVQNVAVRLLDLGGGTTGTDGIFQIDINTQVNEVTLELVNSNWAIVFPVGGKASVPKNSATITEFIIGESTKDILTRAVARSNNDIKNNLKRIGLKQDVIEAALNSFRKEIQMMTDIKVADLKEEIALADKRAEYYPRIASSLTNYINEARDLKDAFKFVARHAFEDPQALALLTEAVNRYNVAYETLNNDHKGYEKAVRDYWESEAKAVEIQELFNYALGELHSANIFTLNLKLRDINEYFQAKEKNSKRKLLKDNILREIEIAELQLDRRLNELDNRTQGVLSKLEL